MKIRQKTKVLVAFVVAASVIPVVRTLGGPAKGPVDPGVRSGAPGAGSPLNNLTADETTFFQDGATRFAEVEVVAGASVAQTSAVEVCGSSFRARSRIRGQASVVEIYDPCARGVAGLNPGGLRYLRCGFP